MKRYLAFLLAMLLVLTSFALVACDEDDDKRAVTSTTAVSTEPIGSSDPTGSSEPAGSSEPIGSTEGEQTPPASSTSTTDKAPADGDVYTLYVAAMNKMSALDSLHVKLNMTMSVEADDDSMTMTVPVTMEMKFANMKNPEDLIVRTVMTMSMMGMETTEDVYMADGYAYYTSEDGNYKMALEDAEMGDMTDDLTEMGANFSEDLLKGITATTENGVMTFTVEVHADQVEKVFDQMKDLVDTDLSGVAFEKLTVVTSINEDGYVISQDMTMKASYSDPDLGSISYDYDIRIGYVDPGKDIVIEAPEGYENYEDLGDLWDDEYYDDEYWDDEDYDDSDNTRGENETPWV